MPNFKPTPPSKLPEEVPYTADGYTQSSEFPWLHLAVLSSYCTRCMAVKRHYLNSSDNSQESFINYHEKCKP